MYVVRGRAGNPKEDRERSRSLLELAADRSSRHLRVWRPPRHVAFGRRDSSKSGYDRAREHARSRDIPTIERTTGGHAVYFTGTTVSFVLATPIDDARSGITERYERTTERFKRALADLSVDAAEGEPDGSFCPGTHSLSANGKIVGLAQRVRRNVAVVAGIVVVSDHEEIADVLGPIYDALDIPFESDATGSIARAGGVSDSETVVTVIEEHFAAGDVTVEEV
ncbi:lipoyl protein ligase domain-containing protein [Halovenus sp. HT40]|uniref:lipoyl protein ligase domain-containing protein n=1 Tax=Halovenus sp. HT40 TaxID=3126691 RepID=UPI00300F1A1A